MTLNRITCVVIVAILLGGPAIIAADSSADNSADISADKLLAAADGFQQRDMPALARAEYHTFLLRFPDHARAYEAHHGLGICYYQMERYIEAIEHINKALASDKLARRAESLAIVGHCYMTTKEYVKANKCFKEVITKYPKSDYTEAALLNYAQTLYLLNDIDRAMAAFSDFTKNHPKSERLDDAMYFMSLCQKAVGKYTETIETLTALLAKYPQYPRQFDAVFMIGQCYELTGKYDHAIRQYKDALGKAEKKRKAEALYSLGVVYYRSGLYGEASTALDKVVTDYPTSEYANVSLLQKGLSQYAGNALVPAMKTFRAVADKDALNAPTADYWLAQCHIARKEYKSAISVLRRLSKLKTAPDNIDQIRFDMASCMLEMKQFLTAAEQFAEFQKDYPKSNLIHHAMYRQAWCLNQIAQRRRYLESAQVCKRLLAMPNGEMTQTARELFAENLFLLKEYKEADKEFGRLVKVNPDDMGKWLRWGQCAYYTGRFNDAASRLTKLAANRSIDDNEHLREGLLLLGDVHLQRKAYAPATEALSRYVAVTKRNRDQATYKLAIAQKGNKQDDKAAANFHKLFEDAKELKTTWAQRAAFEFGRHAYDTNKPAQARKTLELVAKSKAPTKLLLSSIYMLAWLDYKAGDYRAAATKFHAVYTRWPKDILLDDAMYYEAVSTNLAGDVEKALALLQEYVKRPADDARLIEARTLIAECYKKLGKTREAIDELAKMASKGDTRTASVQYQLAWLRRDKGNMEGAVRTYQALLREFPKDPIASAARLELAELLYDQKEYRESTKLLKTVLADKATEDSLRLTATYRLGFSLSKDGQYAEAAAVFVEFAKRYPKSEYTPSAIYEAGEAFVAVGKFDRAISQYTTLMEQFATDALVEGTMLKLAEAQAASGNFDKSLATYNRFVNKYPKSKLMYLAKYGIGWAFENMQKYSEARKYYQELADSHTGPTAARALLQIGRTYHAQGDYLAAGRELVKVDIVYAYPALCAQALYEAGRSFESARKLDTARQQYSTCVTKYRGSSPAELAKKRLAAIDAFK